MRVLALTTYTRQAASSRQRLLQFEPLLAAAGMTMEVRPFFPERDVALVTSGRRVSPARVPRLYAARAALLARPPAHDLVWLQYEAFPWAPGLLERLAGWSGRPMIVDYDDAMFHRYDLHPRPLVRRLLGGKIAGVMRRACLVTAGNAYLAGHAEHAGAGRVEVVPTTVEAARYAPAATARPPGPLTVGWIGSTSTWTYMAPLVGLLRPLLGARGARLLVVGAGGAAAGSEGVECRSWCETREVADLAEMDVGLMPLDDTPWARGKCGYKLIQYMAAGRPVVASPVGVNREIVVDGRTGLLAASPEQWLAAVGRLLDDAALRATMGAAGQARARAHYSLEVWGPRLAALFCETAEAAPRRRMSAARRAVSGKAVHSSR